GKVVFAGGFGTRDLDGTEKADAETLYMIASNTKALTTLMLAKLVEEGKLTWETPVTKVLPSFKLGDADTTSRVLVKHLICACTGLPRQDFEWLFQFAGITPESAIATLGTMQPTSRFGELFQYSNPLASAGGYVGGHVVFPDRELGTAYDEAMRKLVFGPLEMTSTTFDFARAQKGNYARSHGSTIEGKPAHAVMELNYSVIPVRPAGGAWSNVADMLKYVQMELDGGMLPGGTRYIAKDVLLARRAPQVAMNKDATYGMGLMVDRTWGVEEVHHGGDMIGYHSDMTWLPEHGVGAVILTNSDPGVMLRNPFRRKLLELLFDGRPQADADLASNAKRFFEGIAASRKPLTVPADSEEAGKLAPKYANDALGTISVSKADGKTIFDFGEWKSEVATRKEQDGTLTFVTITPGIAWQEFVVGAGEKRTLIVRDAQHEYVFTEQ
ncbi:MAG TPA: serine hydrolase domain-containing protein, partial [Thermoanaerobaculia bacterium]